MGRMEYASDRVSPPVRFWLGRSAKHQRVTAGGPELFQTFNDEDRAAQWMGEDLYNNALWLVELRDGGANGPFFKLTRLEYVKPVAARLVPTDETELTAAWNVANGMLAPNTEPEPEPVKRWPTEDEVRENYARLNEEDNNG